MKVKDFLPTERGEPLFSRLGTLCSSYIPFMGLNTVKRALKTKEVSSLLDLGAGSTCTIYGIGNKNLYPKVNVDLKKVEDTGLYDKYIQGDIRELAFEDKSFDYVICLQCIEHLEKKHALELLDELERITRRKIIISTPCKEGITEEEIKKLILSVKKGDSAPHISVWEPKEFVERGYVVRGDFFPCIFPFFKRSLTLYGWRDFKSKIITLFGYFLNIISTPFVYFFPQKSGNITCIKTMEDK